MMHDLLYAMGFTEAAGNFQKVNGNTKGVEGDPVICNAQDGSGLNNANFLTPPVGFPISTSHIIANKIESGRKLR